MSLAKWSIIALLVVFKVSHVYIHELPEKHSKILQIYKTRKFGIHLP